MKKILLTCSAFFCLAFNLYSQHVFDHNDPIVNYNPSAPPTTPPMNVISKWVRTPRMGWNTSNFKSYYYNDMAFRLRYPNGYDPNDKTKKYPVILFFHGGGEIDSVYDNEFHLLWGAQMFEQMINDGKFNAFMLFPQQKTVGWEETYFTRVNDILDSLQKYCGADPDRVIPMGLSIGGYGVLSYSSLYPQRAATGIASSPSFIQLFVDSRERFKHIPTWVSSGGLDPNPDTYNVKRFVDSFAATGGDIRWNLYPSLAHLTWNAQWSEPHLAPYWNNAHKANPLIFFQKNQFCPDTVINVKIGITPGFYAYEWQRDNMTIATSVDGMKTIADGSSLLSFDINEITVNSFGTYAVRFKRTASSDWSVFSPKPAVISPKPYTATPDIKITGMRSKVLPAPDGSTTVPLELPAGYTSYEWKDLATGTIVSTTRTFEAPPGKYQAIVKEQNICNSTPSPVFKVIDANGVPAPQPVQDLAATRISATAIQLGWTADNSQLTGPASYEVYRSTTAGGPYKLIAVTLPGASTYTNLMLTANAGYYYIVRPVNDNGAAAVSNEAVAPALDVTAPSVPLNLKVVSVDTSSVTLDWDNSTDNIAVTSYDVYVDNVKKYSSTGSTIVAGNLLPGTTYNFTVKAVDQAGNNSGFSNTVTAKTLTPPPPPDTEAPTAPANLTVGTVGTTTVALDWDNSIDNVAVARYEIYVNGVKTYSSATSNIIADNLLANTSYTFTIVAIDQAGNNSALSGAVTVTTLAIAPPADTEAPSIPVNLVVINSTTTTVELNWDNASDNVGVTGYDIYINGVKTYSSATSNLVAANLLANTSYSFTVKAIDLAGNASAFSSAVIGKTLALAPPADTEAPSVPANLVSVNSSSSTIQLDWDNSTDNIGVTRYDIYVNGVKTYSSTTSNVVADNLLPNSSYTFSVKAFDAAGNSSGFSNEAVAKTLAITPPPDILPPSAPANLKVLNTGIATIELDWDNSSDNTGVTGYDIYVNGVKMYTSSTSNIIADRLVANTTYSFTVKAIDGAGNNSASSNTVTAKTLAVAPPADLLPPAIPANLRVVSTGINSITLDWDDATDNVGVTAYDVYVNGEKKYSAAVSTIVANGLVPNTSYQFTVKARDAAGNHSSSSNAVTGKTAEAGDLTAPTEPKTLKVIYTTRTSVELEWQPSTDNVGVTRYDVYVNGLKKYSTTSTSFVATGLIPFESYKFTVKAADAAGNLSKSSNRVTAMAILIGLKYKYYEGAWSKLPEFEKLSPVKKGVTPDIDLDERRSGVNANYAFVWEGFITIDKAGVYSFETRSDDGSKFYFNTVYLPGLVALVNNDGMHEEKKVSASLNISRPGVYPIAVTFFQRTGAAKMKLYWKAPGKGKEEIPISAFSDVTTGKASHLEKILDMFNQDKDVSQLGYIRNDKKDKKKKDDDDDHDDDEDDDDNDHDDDDDKRDKKKDDDDDGKKNKPKVKKNNSNVITSGNRVHGADEAGRSVIENAGALTISKAYPSPFRDMVNIEFTNSKTESKIGVDIFDIYGKLVHNQYFGHVPAGKVRLVLDLTDKPLPPGLYMMRLNLDGKSSNMIKLVKGLK